MRLQSWRTAKYAKIDLPVDRRPDLISKKQSESDRERRDSGYWWLHPVWQERARQWCRERLARLGK